MPQLEVCGECGKAATWRCVSCGNLFCSTCGWGGGCYCIPRLEKLVLPAFPPVVTSDLDIQIAGATAGLQVAEAIKALDGGSITRMPRRRKNRTKT